MNQSSNRQVSPTKTNRAKAFLDTFNQIERWLKKQFGEGKFVGFRRMVDQLSHENELVNRYALDLQEFLQLRNAIVHKSTGEPIAEPSQEALTAIELLYQDLTHPPQASSIAASPVYTCKTTDSLSEVIIQMKQNFYSMVPIYHDRTFVGVFSDHSLTLWLGSLGPDATISPGQETLSGLQEYFGHQDDKYSGYEFARPDTDAYTIRQYFLSFTREKKRLGAVFLTKSGTDKDPIEGIITAWDLPKIAEAERFVPPADYQNKEEDDADATH